MPGALLFDIGRFSPTDGPGIRTVVFFKGCNLRCWWCHNPEGLEAGPELRFDEARCISCGGCIKACTRRAHAIRDGRHVVDADRCARCFACAAACYAGALVQVGRRRGVDEVMAEIIEDRDLYARSGGGVTLSGGEAMLQAEFAAELLARCRAEGIATAIETNLAVPWSAYESLLGLLDFAMVDIKHLDGAIHRRGTGAGNELILENLERLGRCGLPFVVRTPIVPGFNDGEDTVAAIARLAAAHPSLRYYELLAYNPLGGTRGKALGAAAPPARVDPPSRERMRELAMAAARSRVPVRVNGRGYRPEDGEF